MKWITVWAGQSTTLVRCPLEPLESRKKEREREMGCAKWAHAMAMTVAAQETKRGQAGRVVNFMGFPLVHRSSVRPTLEPYARH